jgi:nitroimidazol reductase NimA-like FMN-containing flavoprotein (pyridoxamine 5'-phosphate oxidase superfamily)
LTKQQHQANAYEALVKVRRSDRAKDDAWIKTFLKRGAYGQTATVSDGQPFINTNLYVYDESAHAIYIHTARTGRTRTNIEGDGKVCFSVNEMGRLLPADEALEFSVEYASVVVFGQAAIVEGREEARHGLQLLLDKYAPHLRPGEDYRPITDDEIKRTAVIRINIKAWSGKQKQVEADFPGAYFYGEK